MIRENLVFNPVFLKLALTWYLKYDVRPPFSDVTAYVISASCFPDIILSLTVAGRSASPNARCYN